MAGQNSAKGNPASTRMQNKNLQARRTASWNRGQAHKIKRIAAQDERASINRSLIKGGSVTVHEDKRIKRFLKRHNNAVHPLWSVRLVNHAREVYKAKGIAVIRSLQASPN